MKTFTLDDYTLKIGTNANENDELLTDASQNDIWLHLEKFSSPHGILSTPTDHIVPTNIITWAAQLLKDHSGKQSRYLKNIGVMYLPVKFVQKTTTNGKVNLTKKYSIVKVS